MAKRILVVDDEKDIVDLVAYNLEKEGYRVLRAYDGESALRKAAAEAPDLVILDVMLPGMDGREVCRRLRSLEACAGTPVLMLTAKAEESDKVVGLEMGADDYVTKPFSPKELVARVRALLRRSVPAADGAKPAKLVFGMLELDPASHDAWVKKKPLELTAKEFQLLQFFAERPNRVLTRDTLLEQVWDMGMDVETRTVDVHMRRLRKKLGPAAVMLKTMRGVGYKFVPNA